MCWSPAGPFLNGNQIRVGRSIPIDWGSNTLRGGLSQISNPEDGRATPVDRDLGHSDPSSIDAAQQLLQGQEANQNRCQNGNQVIYHWIQDRFNRGLTSYCFAI